MVDFNGGAIFSQGVIIDLDAALVRVWLRVYFTALLIAIGLLGTKICLLRPQLILLRNGRVPILLTTGWLSAVDAIQTMWLTRSNPLGLMGLVMILAGVIMTVSDLATSGLVTTVNLPGRCPVNTSSVFYVVPTAPSFDEMVATHPASAQAYDIRRSHEANMRNDGVPGLYRVIDPDPRFRASEDDIYGSWRCKDMEVLSVFAPDNTTVNVTDHLFERGLMYTNSSNAIYSWYYVIDGNYEKDMAIWTSNDIQWPDTEGVLPDRKPWDFMIAIQEGSKPGDDIRMHNYHCALETQKPHELDWIFNSTHDAFQALVNWANAVVIHRYSNNFTSVWMVDSPIPTLEEAFNSAFMSLGAMHGENNRRPDGSAIFAEEQMTKGCLLPKAHVPWPVMLLFILVGLILFWFVAHCLLLMIQIRHAQHQNAVSASSLENGQGHGQGYGQMPISPPVGFMSWLKHAVHKDGRKNGDPREAVHTRTLQHWHLKYHDGVALVAETEPELLDRKDGRAGTWSSISRISSWKKTGSTTKITTKEIAVSSDDKSDMTKSDSNLSR